MKETIIIVLLAGLVCSILAMDCLDEMTDLDMGLREVVYFNNDFGRELFELLGRKPGSLLVSPFSLQTVMAMIYSGAAGETAEELRPLLGGMRTPEEVEDVYKAFLYGFTEIHLPSDADLTLANRLFVDKLYELQPKYIALTRDKFFSGATQVNMKDHPNEAADSINKWVELQTKGLVKNVVGESDVRGAALVAVNALHFKANWTTPFFSKDSYVGPFFTARDVKKDVPMMSKVLEVPYALHDNYQAIKLQYNGGFSMVILLPNTVDGIDKLMNSLPGPMCHDLESKLNKTRVEVRLPKFTIESSLKLSEPLKQLGIEKVFTDEAELPGIINGSGAQLSNVLQKTLIKVAEEGTEAAAATAAVGIIPTSNIVFTGPKFRANHPFVFIIKHEATNLALFLGRYSGPE